MADDPTPPADDWKSGLAEDIRSNPSLEGIQDVSSLAKSFIDTKKMVGDSIRIPGQDAKPEEWDKALFSKIGWPEKAEGYSKIDKTGMKEGDWAWDDNFEKFFYDTAHKHRMNNKQANGFLQDLNQHQIDMFKNDQVESDRASSEKEQALKTKFGNALPGKIVQAERFLFQFGGKELIDKVNGNGWSEDADFMSFVINVSDNYAEDHSITPQRGVSEFGSTPEQIKEKIKQLTDDPRYKDAYHRDNSKLVKEISDLHGMLVPK